MLLLLNEHGDPSFLFQNLSSYNVKISLQVLCKWNDLELPIVYIEDGGKISVHFITFRATSLSRSNRVEIAAGCRTSAAKIKSNVVIKFTYVNWLQQNRSQ